MIFLGMLETRHSVLKGTGAPLCISYTSLKYSWRFGDTSQIFAAINKQNVQTVQQESSSELFKTSALVRAKHPP